MYIAAHPVDAPMDTAKIYPAPSAFSPNVTTGFTTAAIATLKTTFRICIVFIVPPGI